MHAANPVRTETPTSRRAQRVIFHFLLPRSSKTHSWWPQDFELCEIFPCLPLCARSTLSSLLLSPRRYPFFLSLFLFRFPLIVRSAGGTAGIWIPPSLYTELSLPRFLLFFFSASLFFSRVHAFFVPRSTIRLWIDRIYPFHHRELERDRPETERIYICIYISFSRKYFSPRISRLVENLCFRVVARGKNRERRKENRAAYKSNRNNSSEQREFAATLTFENKVETHTEVRNFPRRSRWHPARDAIIFTRARRRQLHYDSLFVH